MSQFEELNVEEQMETQGGFAMFDFEMIGQGIVSVFKGLLGGKNSGLFKK